MSFHATFALNRRLMLQGVAASAALAALPLSARAQSGGAEALLFTLADLHCAYARLPKLLEMIRAERDAAGVPAALLINGDLFETGNVVGLRSGGAADWAFVEALAAEMPVVLNLGNHEPDFTLDMAETVRLARDAGIKVISNLTDTRSGAPFADPATTLELGGITLGILGLGVTAPFTYPEETRETLGFTEAAETVAAELPGVTEGTDLAIIMTHAGVTPDKAYIGSLPAGTVMQGGHDHLSFDMNVDHVTYFHGACWGTELGVVTLRRDGGAVSADYRALPVPAGGGDAALLGMIESLKAEHLTQDDSAVIAEIPESLDIHGSILLAAEAVRDAAQADVAMLGHTTFGAPLAAGPLTKYDFDAFIRFGGGISVTEVTGAQLRRILTRANQFRAADLDARTGDYMHVADPDLDDSATYRLAMNGWSAMNQESYLGTTDLVFETVEGLELKALVADHLARL